MKRFVLPLLFVAAALPLSGSTQTLTDYDVNYIRNAVPTMERFVQSLEKQLNESNKRIAALERRLSELEASEAKPIR